MIVLTVIASVFVSAKAQTATDHPRRIIGYFTDWRPNDFTVHQIPWTKVTHINYAFTKVKANFEIGFSGVNESGKTHAILRTDAEDLKPAGTDQLAMDPTLPYKGNFNLLTVYKRKYPDVKSLVSVGGWAESQGFYRMCSTPAGRETFATSAVKFMVDYGFDGVDIDYEYPTEQKDAGNPDDWAIADGVGRSQLLAQYVELMKLLREKIDAQGVKDGKKYLLTVAAPASAWILSGMQLSQYVKYLDYVNMMTYDFHGTWNYYVGHNSALLPNPADPETAPSVTAFLNIDWAFKYFRGAIPASKINIGVPYYSRGWKNVSGGIAGGLWGTAKGVPTPILKDKGDGAVGINNVWHDLDANGNELDGGGNPIWHLKNLLRNTKTFSYVNHPVCGGFDPNYIGTYERYWDPVSKVGWVWNDAQKVWLSLEDEESIRAKVQYIIDQGAGGMMIWELAGDFAQKADGEFYIGDTLTTIAYNMFKTAAPANDIMHPGYTPPAQQLDFDVTAKVTSTAAGYPNSKLTMTVTNNSTETIESGWKLQFNLPISYGLAAPYPASGFREVSRASDWARYEVTLGQGGPWGEFKLTPGGSVAVTLDYKLAMAGGPSAFTLNGFAQKQADPIAPEVPTGLISLGVTDTTADLSWTASIDNIGVVGYDVEATDSLGNGALASSPTTSTTITGLKGSTTYSVKVRARDAAGNVSAWSAPISITTDAPFVDTIAPTVPGTPAASNITHNSLTFSWGISTDNVAVVGYRVYVDTLLDSTVSASDLSVVLTGLTAEKVYTLEVEAFDAAGNAAKTTAITATTLPVPVDTEAPSIPANVSGTGSLNSISVSWAASTDDSGVVAGYDVYLNGVFETTVTGTTVEIINLLTDVDYTVEVVAFDAVPNKSLKSTPIIVRTGVSFPLWSATEVYAAPTKVSWKGAVWQNSWWTQGEEPGVAAVWKKVDGPDPKQKPVVIITAPTAGQKIAPGSVVTLTFTATDADGTVDKVDVYVDAVLSAVAPTQDASGVYSLSIPGLVDGAHSIEVVAVDNDLQETSASVSFSLEIGPQIEPWVKGQVYVKDDKVSHVGKNWVCGWWTTAEPGTTGEWGAWQEIK
jgi:chitinase